MPARHARARMGRQAQSHPPAHSYTCGNWSSVDDIDRGPSSAPGAATLTMSNSTTPPGSREPGAGRGVEVGWHMKREHVMRFGSCGPSHRPRAMAGAGVRSSGRVRSCFSDQTSPCGGPPDSQSAVCRRAELLRAMRVCGMAGPGWQRGTHPPLPLLLLLLPPASSHTPVAAASCVTPGCGLNAMPHVSVAPVSISSSVSCVLGPCVRACVRV